MCEITYTRATTESNLLVANGHKLVPRLQLVQVVHAHLHQRPVPREYTLSTPCVPRQGRKYVAQPDSAWAAGRTCLSGLHLVWCVARAYLECLELRLTEAAVHLRMWP